MQQLVGVCKIQTPFPATEGERQAVQADKQVARQNSVRVKGREIPATTKLVALDDASLARAIVNHAKPLQLDDRELVQPTGVRRNKGNVTIEYKFLEPEERATKGDVGSIPVSHKTTYPLRPALRRKKASCIKSFDRCTECRIQAGAYTSHGQTG